MYFKFSQSFPFLHLHLKGDVICLHLIPNGQFFLQEFYLTENYDFFIQSASRPSAWMIIQPKNWNNLESNLNSSLESYNVWMFDSKSALRGWMQAVRLLSLLGKSSFRQNLLVLIAPVMNFGRDPEVNFERLNLVMHSGDLIMSNVGWVKSLKEIPPSFDPIEVQPVF